DRAARIHAAAVVSYRLVTRLQASRDRLETESRAGWLLLRGDHARLRRDAGLRRANQSRRSLGNHRIHSRVAIEPGQRDRWAAMTESRPFQHRQRHFLILGIAGLVVCALGAMVDVDQCLHSYLFAYFSWLSFSLGALALWLLHNLTGGEWGLALRPIWEAASRTLIPMAVLFVPIGFGLERIYPRTHASGAELGPKVDYLNFPFFLVRAAIYFMIWLGSALLLRRWSAALQRTGDPAIADRMSSFSGPGLIACGLAMTFASIDWIMSLEPDWFSTIFGALVATSQ